MRAPRMPFSQYDTGSASSPRQCRCPVAPVQSGRPRLQSVHCVRQTKSANPAAGTSPAMIEPEAQSDQQRQDENLQRPAAYRLALGIEHMTDLRDLGHAAVLRDPVEVQGTGCRQAEQALPAI